MLASIAQSLGFKSHEKQEILQTEKEVVSSILNQIGNLEGHIIELEVSMSYDAINVRITLAVLITTIALNFFEIVSSSLAFPILILATYHLFDKGMELVKTLSKIDNIKKNSFSEAFDHIKIVP